MNNRDYYRGLVENLIEHIPGSMIESGIGSYGEINLWRDGDQGDPLIVPVVKDEDTIERILDILLGKTSFKPRVKIAEILNEYNPDLDVLAGECQFLLIERDPVVDGIYAVRLHNPIDGDLDFLVDVNSDWRDVEDVAFNEWPPKSATY